LRKIFGLMAVILLLSLRGFGQATTAELSGTVEDASGAVVPGAQVIANNVATNIARSTVKKMATMCSVSFHLVTTPSLWRRRASVSLCRLD